MILNVIVNGETNAAVNWYIDEFGNEVTCPGVDGREVRCPRTVSDPYRANQLLPDDDPKKLPNPDDFHLGPMPPPVSPPTAKFLLESTRAAESRGSGQSF